MQNHFITTLEMTRGIRPTKFTKKMTTPMLWIAMLTGGQWALTFQKNHGLSFMQIYVNTEQGGSPFLLSFMWLIRSGKSRNVKIYRNERV